jgi:phosphatidate phosphatase APP1
METAQAPNAPLLLISDLDDTIKISHTQSKLITVYRGLFRTSAFAGMAQLYAELLAFHPESRFCLVSSSPPQIRRKIEFFLTKNGFPKGRIILRDWIRQSSIVKYKLGSILAMVEEADPGCAVVLIGDDTEHDPEVFARVAKRFPERVAARYLRIVKGRAMPEGSQGFFTAFDVACAELTAGRLSAEQVLRVGEGVLKAEKSSRLIPWFSLKPPVQSAPLTGSAHATIIEVWKLIQEKIQAIPAGKTKK